MHRSLSKFQNSNFASIYRKSKTHRRQNNRKYPDTVMTHALKCLNVNILISRKKFNLNQIVYTNFSDWFGIKRSMSGVFKMKSDCIYHFPIDLDSNGTWLVCVQISLFSHIRTWGSWRWQDHLSSIKIYPY